MNNPVSKPASPILPTAHPQVATLDSGRSQAGFPLYDTDAFDDRRSTLNYGAPIPEADDSVEADPSAPDVVLLDDPLRAQLHALENEAAPNAGKPLTGEMVNRIVRAIRGGAPLPADQADAMAQQLEQTMQKAGITSVKGKAAFIAQVAKETAGFRKFREDGSVRYLSRYDRRKDLGNSGHPDGATFRGRGLLQLTGRSNYAAYSQWKYGDDRVVEHPEMVEQPEDASDSAVWAWTSKDLTPLADAGEFRAVTRGVNGGTNGWADRMNYYKRALAEFARP